MGNIPTRGNTHWPIARSRAEAAPTLPARAVLVVDDDFGTLETFDLILRTSGFVVTAAASAATALGATRSARFDAIVVDLRLPDMAGTELVRILRAEAPDVPIVMVSGFLTIQAAVQAMKLGVLDVIEKPVDLDDLVATLRTAVGDASRAPGPAVARDTSAAVVQAHSVADRWALYVLRACGAETDLKTLENWAVLVAVSYSSLCECCRLLDIRPCDARDLARVLRAVMRSHGDYIDLTLLLDVADRRTLRRILDRAGLTTVLHSLGALSIEQFLERQHFVPQYNPGLRALRGKLTELAGAM